MDDLQGLLGKEFVTVAEGKPAKIVYVDTDTVSDYMLLAIAKNDEKSFGWDCVHWLTRDFKRNIDDDTPFIREPKPLNSLKQGERCMVSNDGENFLPRIFIDDNREKLFAVSMDSNDGKNFLPRIFIDDNQEKLFAVSRVGGGISVWKYCRPLTSNENEYYSVVDGGRVMVGDKCMASLNGVVWLPRIFAGIGVGGYPVTLITDELNTDDNFTAWNFCRPFTDDEERYMG